MDEIDKTALKQQRKERKQQKKQAKRAEQQKQQEKKYLEIKYGPKDHRVKIIPNKPFDSHHPSPQFDIEHLDNNFPSLEQTCHIKNKFTAKNNALPQTQAIPITQTIPTTQTIPITQANHEKSSTKRKKSSALILNITEILSAPSISKEETHFTKNKNVVQQQGNILDASQPIRSRGKHREIPKRKQPSKLKTQIISDSKISGVVRNAGIHSSSFETYCDHIITNDLNILVKGFLSNVVRFQEQSYKRDPIKGNAKRRYIVGLREVKKFVVIKKIKLIIIAPNIRTIVENGGLDTAVQDLISLAKENGTPYIFALSRWKLGEITLKFRPISCVGIFDYSGAEEKYHEILVVSSNARIAYKNLLPTTKNNDMLTDNDESQEITQKFVNICTS